MVKEGTNKKIDKSKSRNKKKFKVILSLLLINSIMLKNHS
jgi:hypothetical protein